MGYRCDIPNCRDRNACRNNAPDRGLSPRSGPFDFHFNFDHAVGFSALRRLNRHDLRCIGRTFPRPLETDLPRGGPRDDIAAGVGYTNLGVIECGMDVNDAFRKAN